MKKWAQIIWLFLLPCCLHAQQTTGNMANFGMAAPEWTLRANIYEVNIRQYTPEGTLKAFSAHLPRLKAMGVDILWLMPVFPIGEVNRKGSLGSYYSIQDYKAINPAFGTMADFDSLVARIHDLGMYVILDWVANHTAWDHPWTRQHPDWYNRDIHGNILVPADNNGNLTDWTDVADLNYNNSEMRKEMISEMLFWAKEHHVDGFRCDIAGFVPLNFWQQAKAELDKAGHFFMLAEDENPDFHTGAFHMTYAWGVHHKMVDVAKGKANAKDLAKTLSDEQVKFAKDAYRMQFIDNHDENSWQGPVSSRFGPGYKAFAVLTYIIPGMPLIYSGQESSLNKSLRFFEKDTIAFDGFYDADFYTRLNMLKHKQAALANGVFGGDFTIIPNSSPEEVLCFVRKKGNSELISLFNLSGKEAKVKYSGDGKITEGRYTEYFSGNKADIQSTGRLSLSPWEYKIYIRDL